MQISPFSWAWRFTRVRRPAFCSGPGSDRAPQCHRQSGRLKLDHYITHKFKGVEGRDEGRQGSNVSDDMGVARVQHLRDIHIYIYI